MTRLSDLFGEKTTLLGSVKSAADYSPIPNGTYVAETHKGELGQHPNTGNPYYKIHWRISEGEYSGRFVFQDLYLTEKALPYTQRDLAKIGITSDEQMEKPIPDISSKIKVALRQLDNGNEHNEVRDIEVIKENVDVFAPLELANQAAPEKDEFLQELLDTGEDKPAPKPTTEEVADWHKETGGNHLPEYVQWVADAIPTGDATTRGKLISAASIEPEQFNQAISFLKPLGLKEIKIGEEIAYWWADETRPILGRRLDEK